MIGIIKNILGVILGFGAGSSLSNKVAGATNYAIFLPVFSWTWLHRAGEISLQIVSHPNLNEPGEIFTIFTTTFGGLDFIIAGVFVYLEFCRRSGPGPGPSA